MLSKHNYLHFFRTIQKSLESRHGGKKKRKIYINNGSNTRGQLQNKCTLF